MRRVIDRCSINDPRLVATVAREPSFPIFRIDELSFLRGLQPLERLAGWSKKLRLKRLTPGLVESRIVKIAEPRTINASSWKFYVSFRRRKSQLWWLLNHFDSEIAYFPSLGFISCHLRLSQSCDKPFRKKKRKGTTRLVANRSSFFRPVSWNDLFQSFRRQDGSQVDLTLRVIAHIFEQGTEEKVRHLFITRPVNFNIVLLFFSFLLYHVSRYNYQPFYS